MKRSPRARNTVSLSESVQQRLNSYALAAGAAGLGLLVLVPPAEGKIVYTPAKVPLMNQGQVFFDLNHDGINDFFFYGQSISRRSISTFFFRLTASPAQRGNAIWGVESHEHASCAAAVPGGLRVGLKRPFQANRVVLFDSSGGPDGGTAYCPWGGKIRTAYLGLKFSIKGQTHFGWARVKIASMYPYEVSLTGYAYETIPGKGIIAGKTKGPDDAEPTASDMHTTEQAMLGALALGAPGLSIWRREQSVAEALGSN
jgi:hypothetical protein